MENLICPHCKLETPAGYNFCVHCDKQIKCLNRECGNLLLPNKTYCLGCGQSIKSIAADSNHPNKFIRTVTQQGKNYSEHTELQASDGAIGALAPFLTGQIASSVRRTYEITGISTPNPTQKTLPPRTQNSTPDDAPTEPSEGSDTAAAEPIGTVKIQGNAAKHFAPDGDKLVAVTKDYKGKTWADQQRNFILLYSSAYQDHFGKPIPKDTIKAVAEKTRVSDANNFSRYVNKAIAQYFVELGTGLKLNPDGEAEVKRIISAIEDNNVVAGFDYWNKVTTPPAKRPRADKNKVNEWLKADVNLDKLDIAGIGIARDYVILALWIITMQLKKADAVSWNDAYYYLKGKYTNISVSPETFSAAVKRDSIKKYVRRNDDDNLFLTTDGQQMAVGWIAGDATPTVEGDDK